MWLGGKSRLGWMVRRLLSQHGHYASASTCIGCCRSWCLRVVLWWQLLLLRRGIRAAGLWRCGSRCLPQHCHNAAPCIPRWMCDRFWRLTVLWRRTVSVLRRHYSSLSTTWGLSQHGHDTRTAHRGELLLLKFRVFWSRTWRSAAGLLEQGEEIVARVICHHHHMSMMQRHTR